MRQELRKLHRQIVTIEGTISRRGRSRNGESRLCLNNVTDIETQETLTDHLWIDEVPEVKNLFLSEGDTIRVTGEIRLYKKSSGLDLGIKDVVNPIKKEEVKIYLAGPSKEILSNLIENKTLANKKFHLGPSDALSVFRVTRGNVRRESLAGCIYMDPKDYRTILEKGIDGLESKKNLDSLVSKVKKLDTDTTFVVVELKTCSYNIVKDHGRYILVDDLDKVSLTKVHCGKTPVTNI